MSEFSSIDDIDLDELYPTGETTPPTKKQEFVRPEPVSPAPPPSTGSGSDLLPETAGTSKGVSSPESYYGETYKDLGITLPDNLLEDLGGEDAVAPQTEIEKGMVLPTPFTEGQWGYSGELAFDMVAMRDKVADARTARWTRQFLKDNDRAPTQDESSQKYVEFAAQANDEIYDLANKVRGARASALPGSQGVPRRFLWLNTDPRGKLYAKGLFGISAAKQEERDFISKVAAPFIVSLAGVEADVLAEEVDEEGRIGQKMIKSPYNESHALGFLDWIGRQSLLSYAATAAVAGSSEEQDSWAAGKTPWALINPINYYRGWGSDKQLELLSRGEDIVSLRDELNLRKLTGASKFFDGAESMGLISPETNETAQNLTEFATAFGLALLDPDLLSLMTLGVGKIARLKTVGKVGDLLGTSSRAKAVRRQEAASVAATKLVTLAESKTMDSEKLGSEVDSILRSLDVEQKEVALQTARAIVSSDPKASRLTEAMANRVILNNRLKDPAMKQTGQLYRRGTSAQEFVGRTAAAIEKGKAPAFTKAKREAYKVGDDLDAYKAAQIEDMWAATALADALTQKRLVTNLKAGTRASKQVGKSVTAEQLRLVANEVQESRKAMQEAFLETAKPRVKGKDGITRQTAKYKKAKKRMDLAVSRFNTLALRMAADTADDSEKVLDQLIATLQVQKRQTSAKLKNVTQAVNKRGAFKVDPKEHQLIIKAVTQKAPKVLEQRALISALAVALREQAAAYGKLSKFIEDTPEARQGLSLTASGGIAKAAELYRKTAEEGAVVGDILRADGAGDIPTGIKWGNRTMPSPMLGIQLENKAKTAREAAEFIVENAEDASYREIAKRILDELPDIPVYLANHATPVEKLTAIAKQTSVNTVKRIMSGDTRGLLYSEAQVGGPKVPKAIIIHSSSIAEGRNAQTILHELMHAATTAKIYEFKDFQKLKDNPAYHKVYKDLSSIHVYALKALRETRKKADALALEKRFYSDDLRDLEKLQNIPRWEESALINIDELVAYGFTNPEFRDFLKTIKMPGKNNTAWSKFVEVITRILGLNERLADGSQTALDRLLRSVDELLDLPAPARAVPEPSAAAKAAPPTKAAAATKTTPKDLPTENLDNMPERFFMDVGRITGGTGTKPIYQIRLIDKEASKIARQYTKRAKLNSELATSRLRALDDRTVKTLQIAPMRKPVRGIDSGGITSKLHELPLFKNADGLPFYRVTPGNVLPGGREHDGVLYEKALQFLNEAHPEGFLLSLGIFDEIPAPQLTKVVNGKIVDEAPSGKIVDESEGVISRMAADAPIDESVRKADDMYTVEQVELLTGWWAKGNKEGNTVRAIHFISSGLKNLWDPAQKVLGPASEEIHQIGVSSLGMIRKVHSDMVRHIHPAVKQAGDEAQALAIEQGLTRNKVQAARTKAEALAVQSYITSTESINGSFMNTIFDGRTLWDMAKPMLRASTGEYNIKEPSTAFNALYKMWLPPGEVATSSIMAHLENTAKNLLMYGQTAKPKDLDKAASREAYRQAANNLSFSDFSMAMLNATANPEKGSGKVDPNAVRVNYFALEAVSQMAIMNMAATRMNKVLADFPEGAVDAAVRLASGDSLNPGQDFVEATKVLNKLKVPGPLRIIGNETNKKIEVGLRMYSDGYGYKAIVPHQWMKQTSELLSKIEKTAEAYSAKELDPWKRQAISTYRGIYRIWHSAILTGLFIPRAAYFTNIYVGNFGQLLSRQGFMAAARYTKESAKDILIWAPQELARQTPLGKYVDAATAKMDAKLGTGFHLSSPTNAFLNRHISMMMDPSLADNATTITGSAGTTYKMGDLRRMAVEQGVFTSFADAAGLSNLLSRTNPGFGSKFWDQIKQGGPLAKRYSDFANTIEQRQRVGLFTDLIVNRGMSPEEAGKVVRDALYDWDSPMTGLETAFAKNVFMFYNFTRRAMGQGMRILLDPYLSSATDTAAEGVLRSSPFLSMLTDKPAYQTANVMAMERTRRELSEYMADEDTAAEYPWWAKKAHNKMFLPNSPMGQERSASYSQTLGKDVNYKVTTVPSITPIEMINQWGDMARILGAYGVAWAVDTPANIIYPEGARPSTVTFKDDVLLPMMGKVAEQAGPFGEEAVQGIMDSIANDKQSYISGGVNVNRLSDRKILEWLEQMGPFMSGISWEDAKNPGRVRTNAMTYALLKALPTISNDVNTLMGPYLDVSAEGGEVSEALLETLTSYLGFKTYRYNPQEVRDWDVKTIRDKMNAMVREENRKVPLGSTKPEVTPAQKANLLEEEEVSEFSSIDDIVIE